MRADDAARSESAVGPATVAFAWTGAVLFAASLGWFFFSYFVRYGAAVAAGPVLRPVGINVLLFTVFAAHHSALARTGAKRWLQRRVTPALERSLYTWVASLLFMLACWFWQPVPGVLYSVPYPWAFAGYARSGSRHTADNRRRRKRRRARPRRRETGAAGASRATRTACPTQNRRRLRIRPPSSLFRLGIDGFRCPDDDRHACRVRARQHALSRGCDPVGRTKPRPGVWFGLRTLSRHGAVADDPVLVLTRS